MMMILNNIAKIAARIRVACRKNETKELNPVRLKRTWRGSNKGVDEGEVLANGG